MKAPKFDEKELRVVKEIPSFFGTTPVYDFPVPVGEAMLSALKDREPVWMPLGTETVTLCPSIISDNIARAFVFEAGEPWDVKDYGGKDIFGIEWVYVPVAGGSMVKPGNPTLEDANDWKEVIKFPDINSWDWEASAKLNKDYLENSGRANVLMLLNGCWFERLISFMDFEGAAMALIDEDQRPAVIELTHKMTDLYLDIVDKCVEAYPLHGICIHDDWGSQMAPFFSDEIAREVYLPEMKRFVDHVHSKGLYCELHSCGHVESRCDVFVEAGFDAWSPMAMNDTVALYEKYGDKIAIGVVNPDPITPDMPEEEIRANARAYAERFCKKGTVAMNPGFYNVVTDAWREELYKASRLAYAEE